MSADIALFNNTSYVGWNPGNSSDEASNVFATLQAQGNTVSTFSGITAADFTAATAGRDILVIPELESGDLNADLDAAARAAIASFVQGGGTLFMFGSTAQEAYDLLNATFGYSITGGSEDTPYPLNNSDAVGTPFEGGPVTLPYNDDTSGITSSSLPGGSLVIYESETGPADSIVTWIPEGSGLVIFFGWDWYDAQPTGTLDGGWLEVMDRAVQAAGAQQVGEAIPAVSQVGVIALVLIIGTLGALMVSRRRLT
jgi:hypothetical protein